MSKGSFTASVAWLKNEEKPIDDTMTDMVANRVLCNRPQSSAVECGELIVVCIARMLLTGSTWAFILMVLLTHLRSCSHIIWHEMCLQFP